MMMLLLLLLWMVEGSLKWQPPLIEGRGLSVSEIGVATAAVDSNVVRMIAWSSTCSVWYLII